MHDAHMSIHTHALSHSAICERTRALRYVFPARLLERVVIGLCSVVEKDTEKKHSFARSCTDASIPAHTHTDTSTPAHITTDASIHAHTTIHASIRAHSSTDTSIF